MIPTTLVLLSGLDGTGRLFKPLIEALPSHLKPLVIPYPAHQSLGYSDLVLYVRGKLPAAEPFILLAESFSGAVAVELAATHPANLKALILCASFVTNPVPGVFRHLRFIFDAQFFKLRPPRFVVRYLLSGHDAPSELINTFLEVFKSVSPEVLSSRMQSMLTVDVRDALRECRVPILYLVAKRDKLVGERNLVEIKSLASNVETITIDAPHFLLQRAPEAATEAIDNYLRRVVGDI